MPRYIADSYLYRAIGADIDGACGKCAQSRSNCMCHSFSRMDICGIIDDAPTADVVEVVRCKDCKHWGETLSKEERETPGADLVCSYWESDGLMADDFCSKAERRDDDETDLC